jgi:hypothetical protein
MRQAIGSLNPKKREIGVLSNGRERIFFAGAKRKKAFGMSLL